MISGVNGQPLQDAGVTCLDVRDGKVVAKTRTDLEGRFLSANLSDDRFEWRALHWRFVTMNFEDHQGFSTAIVTSGALDTTGLRFTFEPEAAIYGMVTEDSGDAVPNAEFPTNVGLADLAGSSAPGSTGANVMVHFEFPRLAASRT